MQNEKKLGFFSLTMIVISLVIGMGIFKTPAVVAAKSGSETIFYSAWIIGGIIALFGALIYAEIGIRLPVVGGFYKVISYAYHPAIGFTINALILISNAASVAVVALIGAEYVGQLVGVGKSSYAFNTSVATVSVLIFYLVNLAGLTVSSRTQNILTVVKIGLVVLLISAVFKDVMVPAESHNTDAKIYSLADNSKLYLLMISMVAVSFTYGGYQQTLNFGGEVKSSATLQRSIVLGMFIVLVLYFAISHTYIKVIGFDSMKNADAIGGLLCKAWFGTAGQKVFNGLMFLSVLAYVNVSLMSNPRVMYAMSIDKIFPKQFAYLHPKTKALVPALTAFSFVTIAILFFGKGVDDIMTFSIFIDSLGLSMAAASLYILRKRKTNDDKVKGFMKHITPVLLVLYIISYAIVATAVYFDNKNAFYIAVALIVLFLMLYFIFSNLNSKETKES